MATELMHCLALWRMPGMGARRFAKLLEAVPDLSELFVQPTSVPAFSKLPAEGQAYLQAPDWAAVEHDLAWGEQPGHYIVRDTDPAYPPLLKEIGNAPPLLFVRGDPDVLHLPQLAMVGSRNPTPTGAEWAHDFASQLCQGGFTVTSGLALGIDAASHRGALVATGRTIAVLGTGVDSIYPHRHGRLAEDIIESGGAIVSELPLGTAARAPHFPQRNRIISGLSLGVLVVEAALRSGSLITARLATEQGREVFALPGSVHNPLTRGCHALIRQGAKLVETTDDIVEELSALVGLLDKRSPQKSAQTENSTIANSLDTNSLKLLKSMDYEFCSVDRLVERSGLTPSQVSSILLRLELAGRVKAAAGAYQRLTI